ncbi:hypothetical protein ACFFQF_22660 [Haladaptatus pallidirubidus]|uniref:hypothetical protein n=1 Tax=Haladaptatus pallidirubidus TaxID=1008152 RepID=UPI0035EDEDA7
MLPSSIVCPINLTRAEDPSETNVDISFPLLSHLDHRRLCDWPGGVYEDTDQLEGLSGDRMEVLDGRSVAYVAGDCRRHTSVSKFRCDALNGVFRPTRSTISAPSSANSRAIARQIPVVPPMTTAVSPSSLLRGAGSLSIDVGYQFTMKFILAEKYT